MDLRKDIGLQRSVLLHRLNLLDISWGTLSRTAGLGTFKESWVLLWQPELAIAIIDASASGNTVASAAAKRMTGIVKAERTVSGIADSLETVQLTDLTALPCRLRWSSSKTLQPSPVTCKI